MTANFNACLRHATGEYIQFLCADDLLLPGSLRRMSRALADDSRVTLAVGGRELINEHGDKIAVRKYSGKDITIPGVQAINPLSFRRKLYRRAPSCFGESPGKEASRNRYRSSRT